MISMLNRRDEIGYLWERADFCSRQPFKCQASWVDILLQTSAGMWREFFQNLAYAILTYELVKLYGKSILILLQ